MSEEIKIGFNTFESPEVGAEYLTTPDKNGRTPVFEKYKGEKGALEGQLENFLV
ncbi:MAG: hypothetical protein GY804_06230 [Alphaproteobacteria bacterium]|nr:hypothetical protein [Alphaproteobacteria bacterium]